MTAFRPDRRRLPLTPAEIDACMEAARAERARVAGLIIAALAAGVKSVFAPPARAARLRRG